ncbi:MAG: hypothetical protein HKM07_01495 [Chlamydiae bacterium]|nr:hypothetical protein [Chlamydiota bacterium]
MVQVTLDSKVVTDAIAKGAAYISSKLPSVASMQVGGNLLSVGMGAVAGYHGGRAANIADTVAKGFLSALNGLSGGSVAKSIMKDVQDFRAAGSRKEQGAAILSGLTNLMGSVALITDAATTVASRYVKSDRFDTFVAVTKGLGALSSLAAGREIFDLKASITALSAKQRIEARELDTKQGTDRQAAMDSKVTAFTGKLEYTTIASVIGSIGKESAANDGLLAIEKAKVDGGLEGNSQENVDKLTAQQDIYVKLNQQLAQLNAELGKGYFSQDKSTVERVKGDCVASYRALVELKNAQQPKVTKEEQQARTDLATEHKVQMKNHASLIRPIQSIAYAFTAGLAAAKHFVPQNSYINRAYQVSVAASMLAGAAGILKHSVPNAPMTLSNVPSAWTFATTLASAVATKVAAPAAAATPAAKPITTPVAGKPVGTPVKA